MLELLFIYLHMPHPRQAVSSDHHKCSAYQAFMPLQWWCRGRVHGLWIPLKCETTEYCNHPSSVTCSCCSRSCLTLSCRQMQVGACSCMCTFCVCVCACICVCVCTPEYPCVHTQFNLKHFYCLHPVFLCHEFLCFRGIHFCFSTQKSMGVFLGGVPAKQQSLWDYLESVAISA